MMNNIVTIDLDTWNMLLLLKNNIRFYKEANDTKYDIALSKCIGLYQEHLRKVA